MRETDNNGAVEQPAPPNPFKIICGGMIACATFFLAIAPTPLFEEAHALRYPPMVNYIGAGIAVVLIVMCVVIPNRIAKSMIRNHQSENDQKTQPTDQEMADMLYTVFMVKTMIGFAFVETAAFLNTIAYMTTLQWWSAAIVVVLIAIMAARFPTESRARHWGELQSMNIQQ